MAYVLRLSPLIHQVLETFPESGIVSSNDIGFDGAQAFSTYLHETVHWWQHIGSTFGLMSSVGYPARTHSNHNHIKKLFSLGVLKKPISQIPNNFEGPSTPETAKGIANIVINNHFDLSSFSRFSYNRKFAETVASNALFENLGHVIHITYRQNMFAMASVVDPAFAVMPDPRTWAVPFEKLKRDKVEGFYYGSPVALWPLGAHEIMEGQACFSQIQYLHFASGGRFEWDTFRALGMLHGVYEAAFSEFLRCAECDWPMSISDPVVALFLLVCDLAINPGSGFPFDPSPFFATFISDTIPGIRFTAMARTIRMRLPELLSTIKEYSREEYEVVSNKISSVMMNPSPMQIAARFSDWAKGAMSSLMDEYRTYDYLPENHAIRVLLSHFLAFSQDKFRVPELFCWPGAWMAGEKTSPEAVAIFERHGALFVDRKTDTGIYPRMRKSYDEAAIQKMFDKFYAAVVTYGMTDQLIEKPGPFAYRYDWLKPSASSGEFKRFADEQFSSAYGIAPDEIEVG